MSALKAIQRAALRAPRWGSVEPRHVIWAAALRFGVPIAAMTTRRRHRRAAYARFVAMWLMHWRMAMTDPAVGRHLGGRAPSTVQSGREAVQAWRARGRIGAFGQADLGDGWDDAARLIDRIWSHAVTLALREAEMVVDGLAVLADRP